MGESASQMEIQGHLSVVNRVQHGSDPSVKYGTPRGNNLRLCKGEV